MAFPWDRQKFVDNRRYISVLDLPKQSFLDRDPLERRGFWARGFHLEWRRDRAACDTYVELLNRGPKNRLSAFTLVSTACNYGGKRHWFLCPRCEKRTQKLYEESDDFFCRKCLGLDYISHLTNYRSMEPFIRRLAKYNKTEFRAEYSFYKGRMTKRAVREEKLRRRVELAAPFAIMQLDKMAQDGEETEEKKVRGRSF